MIWSGNRALVICKQNEFVFTGAKVTVYEGVHCTTDNIILNIYFFCFFLFFLKSKSNRYQHFKVDLFIRRLAKRRTCLGCLSKVFSVFSQWKPRWLSMSIVSGRSLPRAFFFFTFCSLFTSKSLMGRAGQVLGADKEVSQRMALTTL